MQLLLEKHRLLGICFLPKAVENCVDHDRRYRRTQGRTECSQIEIFFCICSVSRQFVRNFAKLAFPHKNKLQNDQPFNL